ncbi:MAG: DNA mismatch endonuclease Vsr [Bryobacterales bacterium]|nr:DNA mismatch endonuclease Vsr [Bryobacterales bacterium]
MDVFSPRKRSAVMRMVKSRDTAPELSVRKLIRDLGFRYRLHRKDLPGCPDIVLSKLHAVIFVHGCFWHQHRCKAGAAPTSRRAYWDAKLQGNVRRDRRNWKLLRNSGWKVLIIWECEIREIERLTRKIRRFLAPLPSP